jgi:hypothetical protein
VATLPPNKPATTEPASELVGLHDDLTALREVLRKLGTDVARDGAERAERLANTVASPASDVLRSAGELIRKRPIAAVVGALAVGVALGRVWAR